MFTKLPQLLQLLPHIFPLDKTVLLASKNPAILRWQARIQQAKIVKAENQQLQTHIKTLEAALEVKTYVFDSLYSSESD